MKIKLKQSTNENVIDRILENRNVKEEELEQFLMPPSEARMHPANYYNMDLLVSEIVQAIDREDKIALIVDSDCDGYCSGAMMYKLLVNDLKCNTVQFFMHSGKTHGLTAEMMEKIKQNNIEAVIVVDAGSNDYEAHKVLKEKGIKVLIVDHHECDRVSKDAIIVNNQFDTNTFSNKSLSAGGMMLKVIEYFSLSIDSIDLRDYLDLGAVAIIADMMELVNLETRFYAVNGVREFVNPLLVELLGEYNHSFEDVSFKIAPLINAITRVGEESEKIDLFCALTGDTRYVTTKVKGVGETKVPLQTYVAGLSNKVKYRQQKLVKEALNSASIITENLPFSIVILDENALRELTGLIGNKVVEMHKKPAYVFKFDPLESLYKGSARTHGEFKFKDYTNGTGLFSLAQGHQGAFGVAITQENLNELYQNSMKFCRNLDSDITYEVDKSYDGTVSAYDILEVNSLKDYWCKGFEEPKFHVKLRKVKASERSVIGVKKDTFKITKDGITFIKFKCTDEEVEEYLSADICDVDIVGKFNVNEWNGREYCQMIIEAIEIGESVNITEDIINHFAFMDKPSFTFQI